MNKNLLVIVIGLVLFFAILIFAVTRSDMNMQNQNVKRQANCVDAGGSFVWNVDAQDFECRNP